MIRNARLLALVVAMSAAVPTTTTIAQDDQGELRSYYAGNGMLNRGLYDLAADEYRAFLAAHPDHDKAPSARYGLGVCLFRTNDFAGAMETLGPIEDLDEFAFAAEVQMVAGQSAVAVGDHDGAVQRFATLLERHETHDLADEAAGLLVESCYRAARHDEARRAAAMMLQRWPESPRRERAELFDGLAAMAQSDWAGAADRFDAMTTQFSDGPHSAQATLLLAQCAHRADRDDQAREAYRRSLSGSGAAHRPDALYGLALLEYEAGAGATAAPLLDALLEDHLDDDLADDAYLLRGRVHFDDGAYDDAMSHFAAVGDADPDLAVESVYWTAKCELRQDRAADAAARLSAAITAYPEAALRGRMLYDLAVAHVRSDDGEAAIPVLEIYLSENADGDLAADATHLLAFTFHRAGNYDASRATCETFVSRFADHPEHPSMVFLIAENDFLAQRYDEAVAGYSTFLEQHGADERATSGVYRMGMALYHLDRHDEAEPFLTQITSADVDTAHRSAHLALGDIQYAAAQWAEAEASMTAYLASGDDVPARDDALLKQGLARQRQDDNEGALDSFRTLLAEHDDSVHAVHARFESGQALAALGRNAEAQQVFETLVANDDESRYVPHALNHLATIAMNDGEHARAAELFRGAAEASSDDSLRAGALHKSALAHVAARDWEDAVLTWDAFLQLWPSHDSAGEATARRAVALARLDRYEDAIAAIDDAIARYDDALAMPLRTSIRYERAWCCRGLDRADDAAATYRDLLSISSTDPMAIHSRLELAEIEMDGENYEVAARLLDELDEVAAEVPENVREQAIYRRGVCAFRLEAHDVAIERFETMLQEYPQSTLAASAGLLCGEAHYATGNNGRAATHLAAVVENHADDPAAAPALLRLGEAQGGLQHWDKSEASFTAYLDRHRETDTWYQAQFGLAWAMENQGRHDEAIEAYRVVVDEHRGPTAARAQFQVGECLYALERHQDAVRELLKVDILYDYPEWSAAALYEAGRCFEALNDPVNARVQYEQVRTNHGDTRWAALSAERIEAIGRTGLPGRE